MAEVIELNTESFEKEVINSELPVLVDCWAPWCQPCLMVSPIVEEVAEEYHGKVKFYKLNVDESRDIAIRYGIMSIPTLLNSLRNYEHSYASHLQRRKSC